MPNQPQKPRPAKAADKASSAGDGFEAVAKRLECDEDKDRFEAKLGRLAKAKPMSEEHRAAWAKLDKGGKP